MGSVYAQSDEAIAKMLAGRIKQRRLELNLTQEAVAEEAGISRSAYQSLELHGTGKITSLIGVLRALNALDEFEQLVPDRPHSPIAILKAQGQKRLRASQEKVGVMEIPGSRFSGLSRIKVPNNKSNTNEDSDW
ncbi:helix-turn-helix domain-containing protein [Neptuniibacter sp. QD34_54]|uniref:helix-turn-helix domain-containing protein n=1 Tax=Neptuniibacter sp. QD34_54 TaxID=3398208 RepID=UPI0039F48A88